MATIVGNGTILAAGTGTAMVNPSYTFPMGLTASINKSVGITVIAIPLNDNPLLMNFGGATIKIQMQWITITQSDVAFLYNYFASAANISYTITFPEWNGIQFTGFVDTLTIQQTAGENSWACSLTLDVGTAI